MYSQQQDDVKHTASDCCQLGRGIKEIYLFSRELMLFFSALKLKNEDNQVLLHHSVFSLTYSVRVI